PLIMSSVSLSNADASGVLILDTTQAMAGQAATITVTATDPMDGTTTRQYFIVAVGAYGGPIDPAINFRPLAFPVVAQTFVNTAMTLALAGQNGYPDARQPAILRYTMVSPPSHGTIRQFDPLSGNVVYTPDPGYAGTDSFQFALQSWASPMTPPEIA